ncbi:MAG: L,D-transpeptidase [Xanthobacteraceae bacterium]|nr:L,D-transpeptidase [Xanthobacteraceae bacterium]
MINRLMTAQSTLPMRRWRHPAIAGLAAMAALMALTTEATAREPRPERPPEATAPRDAGEPIMAIVSIKSQKVTFYDADGWITRAPVSTGTTGRETPAGVFALLEKDKDHHSTMYDDASMPNMQRITWNGLALHGGPLPGYAASHGCVRMPFGFAEKLFDKTRIGMRVIVSPNDAEPVEFSHPSLFMPNQEAITAAPSRAEALARDAEEAVKAAGEAKKAAAKAPREIASIMSSLRKLEALKTRADADLVSADKALAAADQAKAQVRGAKQTAAAKATDLATQLDTAKTDAKPKLDALAATQAAASTDEEKKAAATAAREAGLLSASLQKLEMLQKNADAELAAQDKMLAAADEAMVRAQDLKQKAAAKAADLATQLDAANTDARPRLDALAATKDAAKAADKNKADTARAANDAKLALEPVSIYISRATQKLYVRRNTHKPAPDGGGEVFDSSLEVPVTIRDPDKRIGTHVFTAMARNDSGLRWSAVTIDNSDDAKDALDRITIPQEVLDRIAPTALPRSSIVISDEPLSKETNYRTEFVAVLNNQPQGGFITRKPTPVLVANRDVQGDDFFGLFFQRNPNPQPVDPRRRGGRQYQQVQQPSWW